MHNCKQIWLFVFSWYMLYPFSTDSTPLPVSAMNSAGHSHTAPCPHESIAELIKTSPVIVKALGARVFTDDDLSVLQMVRGEQDNWQNGQNNFLTSATLDSTVKVQSAATPTTTRTATASATLHNENSAGDNSYNNNNNNNNSNNNSNRNMPTTEVESILITLTPETIYKGASLLKMTPGAENAARSNLGSSSSSNGYGNQAESAYQYEGQLNATLEPLACFDGNVLKMLPTELIAFGKLITVQQQQLQQGQQSQSQERSGQKDILRISINGLHRWSPQFENHIWKHLGWDDWSDFTLCSVTCGKGVQQRFRRCLLDNPMMNLNMNMNLNAVVDDDDDDDVVIDGDVEADEVAHDAFAAQNGIINEMETEIDFTQMESDKSVVSVPTTKDAQTDIEIIAANDADNSKTLQLHGMKEIKIVPTINAVANMSDVDLLSQQQTDRSTTNNGINISSVAVSNVDNEDTEHNVLNAIVNNFNEFNENLQYANSKTSTTSAKSINKKNQLQGKKTERDFHKPTKKHRSRKSTKTFSTLFCEGYNIEQRNCNTFECRDDINDLLKFYKKFPMFDDISAATMPLATDINTSTTIAAASIGAAAMSTDSVVATATTASSIGVGTINAAVSLNAMPSSTPSNMGYVKSWHNALNFTLMTTLRAKNDSRTTATIFSIRNTTHNLYLESCKDGLRLYLERDNTTEMLPVKFNLYDYRWHQVAISIQNGDFISVFVDCSWTNSFIVSKRLFSLPLDADVEIGRGFNGELQQLLVLPENQERHQCSNKRTSINEVKRYIIDTFIDDYGN